MATAVLEQIRKLDDQKNKLRDQAKDEMLGRVEEALSELNALGFNYSIVSQKVRGSRTSIRERADVPCPVCKFKTNPPHDGRRHRAQGDNKKAFTAQELTAFGFVKA